VLINGDRITGEIKGLEHNQLRFRTEHMGTIYMSGQDPRVQTNQYLLLERSDGGSYYGQTLSRVARTVDCRSIAATPGAHLRPLP